MTEPDAFRDLVVRELTQVIIANACDRTERHAVRVAEAIADRLTCPNCGFIDIGCVGNAVVAEGIWGWLGGPGVRHRCVGLIGWSHRIGNPPNNVCNDCAPAPRHWRTT